MADEKPAAKAKRAAAPIAQYKGEAPSMTNEEIEAKIVANEGTSSSSQFSTYAEADVPATNPPAGRIVEQTPGEPVSGAAPTAFGE